MSVANVGGAVPMAEEKNLFEPVGKSSMDQYDFMNLFITQLQYQDPMEPMSTEAMAGQLADFSNMEATLRMSDSMDKLLDYQTSQNNLQLLTLLDNDVKVSGNILGVNEGTPGNGEFVLDADTSSCQVEIYDAGGRLVDMMDLGPLSRGTYDLDWDATNALGEQVADGAYSYRVKGLDSAGNEVDVDYRIFGRVTGVSFEDGLALLTLDKHVAADVGSVMSVL